MFVFSWVGSALASCAATCACNACTFTSREVMRRSARLAYCFLFTLAMILAWVLRDFAKPLMEKLPCTAPDTLFPTLKSTSASATSLQYTDILLAVEENKDTGTTISQRAFKLQGLCTMAPTQVTASMVNRRSTESAWETLCAP